MATRTLLQSWRERPAWARSERSGWKSFAIAIGSLAAALLLALYSSAAAERGEQWLAAAAATAALAVAAWVSIAIVPRLARRTQLRWLAVHIDYRVTREGVVFFGVVIIVALAALNTGNNLLFMVLASMLAAILVSGVASQSVLSDVEVRLELPENIFAGQPVVALAELVNHKQTLPSFSLRLVSEIKRKKKAAGAGSSAILTRPIYFPYLPRRQPAQQTVELCFPRRGVYRQDALGLQTRFPFGFLEKTRAVESHLEAVVYPPVEPTDEFYEILPLVSGELESFLRGRGHDLYAIRDYQNTDTARHVDWKASAKKGVLQVREFAREDERRVLLVLDPFVPEDEPKQEHETVSYTSESQAASTVAFERGVTLCASLAWHFYEINSVLAYRCAGFETPLAPAGEVIYDILGHLARVSPSAPVRSPVNSPIGGRSFLDELADAPQIFKIILTRQARGSIPTSLWNSSYIIFLDR